MKNTPELGLPDRLMSDPGYVPIIYQLECGMAAATHGGIAFDQTKWRFYENGHPTDSITINSGESPKKRRLSFGFFFDQKLSAGEWKKEEVE